jgi:hypothetical protein
LIKKERRRNIGRTLNKYHKRGLVIKMSMIQDASFILGDPDHAKIDEPRGEEAMIRSSNDDT